jgi:hypothetical protein
MWTFITDYCTEKNLVPAPKTIHIDFEKAMHKAISSIFPNTSIMCCRFHLGQNFWRKNQSLGLSALYKDKSSDVGKWLSKFFGLPFLSENEVKDSFAEDIMLCKCIWWLCLTSSPDISLNCKSSSLPPFSSTMLVCQAILS